jgi:hypothetical protein
MAREYLAAYREYCRRLIEAGVALPDSGEATRRDGLGRRVVYVTQARLDPAALAPAVLRRGDAESGVMLFRKVLTELGRVLRYNAHWRPRGFELGFDAHIANWAVTGLRGTSLAGDERLVFLDTNSPMMRVAGRDWLSLEVHEHLLGVPRMARRLSRTIGRRLLRRYFDPRSMVLENLANVAIHGRPDLVARLLPIGNAFLAGTEITPTPASITPAEVDRFVARDLTMFRTLRSVKLVTYAFRRRVGPRDAVRRIHHVWTHPLYAPDAALVY